MIGFRDIPQDYLLQNYWIKNTGNRMQRDKLIFETYTQYWYTMKQIAWQLESIATVNRTIK